MSNLRYFGSLLAVLTALLAVPAIATAVCAPQAQPGPMPMLYPGQMGVQPGCCPGPCMCVPNVCTWGHFQKQWCPWPGDATRADVRFSIDRGIEHVRTPQGTIPTKLPKEEYVAPEAETGPGIQIEQGAPTGPVEPPAPFDFGSGLEGLPGLDTAPQGPTPGPGPSPAEGAPGGANPTVPQIEAPTTGTPSSDSVPPAPLPAQSSFVPAAPAPVLSAAHSAPSIAAPESDVPALSASYQTETDPVAPRPSTTNVPSGNWELSPGEGESPLPPQTALQTNQRPLADTAAASAEPSCPPTVEPPAAETAPMPDLALTPDREPPAVAASESVSPAPLPSNSSPAETPKPEKTALSDAAGEPAKPWSEPGNAWKSRRAPRQASREQTVDYEEPVEADSAGLDGYCPVELVRHEQWVEGRRQWAVRHQGRTYLMSGPAQQRLFRANPERYVPVLAGCDLVLAATGAGRVAGQTDSCVIYEGRLYMFSSQATLAQFRQNPGQYTKCLDRSK